MSRSRIDKLTERLRARTARDGKPLPGYRENVAAIKAEIAILSEQLESADDLGATNDD